MSKEQETRLLVYLRKLQNIQVSLFDKASVEIYHSLLRMIDEHSIDVRVDGELFSFDSRDTANELEHEYMRLKDYIKTNYTREDE